MGVLARMRRMSEVHAVARLCRCSPAAALALLSEAEGLARWNLGLWHTRDAGPGLVTGRSLFGGGSGLARVQVNAQEGWVNYAVGASEAELVSRIQARVQSGPELGYAEGHCMVTLLAWRTAGMADDRWERLKAAHEVEIDLIRAALEGAG